MRYMGEVGEINVYENPNGPGYLASFLCLCHNRPSVLTGANATGKFHGVCAGGEDMIVTVRK